MTTKLAGLTSSNVAALAETMDGQVETTKTTATFPGTASEALAAVQKVLDTWGGGNAHPRGSLHAVARKLKTLVAAEHRAAFDAALAEATDEPVELVETITGTLVEPSAATEIPGLGYVANDALDALSAAHSVADIDAEAELELQFDTQYLALSTSRKALVVADYLAARHNGHVADVSEYATKSVGGDLAGYARLMANRGDYSKTNVDVSDETAPAPVAPKGPVKLENVKTPKPVPAPVALVKIAAVSTGRGDIRVHDAGCRDVQVEVAKFGQGPAYVGQFADQDEFGFDWFADVASDEFAEGTPEHRASALAMASTEITYLPCCTLPGTTKISKEENTMTVKPARRAAATTAPAAAKAAKTTAAKPAAKPVAATPESVVLPDGIKETPALRPVYAAMLNGVAGTAADFERATGIIVPKIRVALNTLEAVGLAVSTKSEKVGVAATWALVAPVAKKTAPAKKATATVPAPAPAAKPATGKTAKPSQAAKGAQETQGEVKLTPVTRKPVTTRTANIKPSELPYRSGPTMRRILEWMMTQPGRELTAAETSSEMGESIDSCVWSMYLLGQRDSRITAAKNESGKNVYTFGSAPAAKASGRKAKAGK